MGSSVRVPREAHRASHRPAGTGLQRRVNLVVTCMCSGQAAPMKPAHTWIAQACAIFMLPPTSATRQNLVPPLLVTVSSVRLQRHRVKVGCCDHEPSTIPNLSRYARPNECRVAAHRAPLVPRVCVAIDVRPHAVVRPIRPLRKASGPQSVEDTEVAEGQACRQSAPCSLSVHRARPSRR